MDTLDAASVSPVRTGQTGRDGGNRQSLWAPKGPRGERAAAPFLL